MITGRFLYIPGTACCHERSESKRKEREGKTVWVGDALESFSICVELDLDGRRVECGYRVPDGMIVWLPPYVMLMKLALASEQREKGGASQF